MGRHSRRGPAPRTETTDITPERTGRHGNRADGRQQPVPGAPADGMPGPGAQGPADGTPARGARRLPEGAGTQGAPGFPGDGSAQGRPGVTGAAWAPGGPQQPEGGRARGTSGFPAGSRAQGTPGFPAGAPAYGVGGGTGGASASGAGGGHGAASVHGAPATVDGAPARGVPRFPEDGAARGGHPEQREAGGGWGELGGRRAGGGGPGVVLPRQRRAEPAADARRGSGQGPRQEYVEAFDDAEDGQRAGRRGAGPKGADASASGNGTGTGQGTGTGKGPGDDPAPRTTGQPGEAPPASGTGVPGPRGGGKGRTFTGIAAAAVTTVLAVMVAGQVTKARDDGDVRSQSATGHAHDTRTSGDSAPSAVPSAAPLTYDQKMSRTYPLGATLSGPGKFDVVPGFDKAPGTGQKYRYRVDVEQGLGLDGALFAEAVQKTLNDRRSWAHGGARTFERISSGTPDFVITLASPGTTAQWCAKSGLDTTEDNVSCDSAATERVMINAYRWAQGSTTYGDRIHAYRQMLINHEVGHRLGHGHVTCQKDGELAPVMQQQTKFLDHDGIHCRANAWPYPGS
ncbi:DUF3152 domain-containing protein [Streptomyces sp. CSDS2]|uniref:DUF3152 domain-containing protein n=1 Tax=Streptomyces sp. CSDS2 TaxID=3055051 RepID=UPI0025B03D35|nr:DUF3152 domain-containing protein [Streptomyces sp. CSDS2]MDN3264965.1 DUF3152 domain-containing protein [Streptomyces sp. CSDS2]